MRAIVGDVTHRMALTTPPHILPHFTSALPLQVPSVWAIGDVTHRMDLTPVALMEGKALAATLFGGKPTVPDYENVSGRVGWLRGWGGWTRGWVG